MDYDDEDPPVSEPDPELDELVRRFIGVCIEVHKHTGAGLDEATYEGALAIELELQRIPFSRQAIVEIGYKGRKIGERRLDFIIAGRLVVEIKAVEQLTPLHSAQLLTYLRATNKKLGVLANFNVPLMGDGLKRIFNPQGS
jgi:GxxExxY protein